MKKCVYVVLLAVLFGFDFSEGGVSVVMNSSFEENGRMDSIIATAPVKWVVNRTSPSFGGNVGYNYAWTKRPHGDYCLTLVSNAYGEYDLGNMIKASQQVYMDQATMLTFSVKLATDQNRAWDGAKRSAAVLIGDEVIWQSPAGADIRGEYVDQTYVIDAKFKDGNKHELSLVLVSNVDESWSNPVVYRVSWDVVRFDVYCGGFGYLPGDLNLDCYVDFLDYGILADKWLADANELAGYGMPDVGLVDERSLYVIAKDWLGCTEWIDANSVNCTVVELPEADVNQDGIVDCNEMGLQGLLSEWLLEEPNELNYDLDDSGYVDGVDYAIKAQEAQGKNWLYGMESE